MSLRHSTIIITREQQLIILHKMFIAYITFLSWQSQINGVHVLSLKLLIIKFSARLVTTCFAKLLHQVMRTLYEHLPS